MRKKVLIGALILTVIIFIGGLSVLAIQLFSPPPPPENLPSLPVTAPTTKLSPQKTTPSNPVPAAPLSNPTNPGSKTSPKTPAQPSNPSQNTAPATSSQTTSGSNTTTTNSNNTSGTTLAMSPASLSLKVGSSITHTIEINAGGYNLAGVQFDISFDPSKVSLAAIKSGTFFTSPNVLSNKIDNERGIASYAIGSFKSKTGSGTLATFTITANTAASEPVKIEFANVKVADMDSPDNVFKSASPVFVTIN